jgi:benzoyl-CoA reductase/2-hydroxyglutaryl-CoA dehydratase subunit BcrC/BadD/HgdB
VAILSTISRPLIAIVGLDVPLELVRAAGFKACRLKGNPDKPSPVADRLLGPRVDPQIRSLAEALLTQGEGQFKGLLISHDNHSHLRLFNALRAIRARDESTLPPIHFCDLLHSVNAASESYNRTRLLELTALLSRWADSPIRDTALRAQIAAANHHRATLRGISAFRRETPPRYTGSQTLAILSGAWTDEHQTLPPETRSGRTPRRVFLTGSSHDHTKVYEAIEAAGCVIVSEDHDWGDPGIDVDLDECRQPIDAFLNRLASAPPASAQSSIAQRAAYVTSAALNASADAVIAFVRDGDAGPRWDVADQRRALDAVGLPLLLLDDQPYWIESAENITAAVRSFLETRQE